MSARRLGGLLVLAALQLAASWWWAGWQARQAQEQARRHLATRLETALADANLVPAFGRLARNLLPRLHGKALRPDRQDVGSGPRAPGWRILRGPDRQDAGRASPLPSRMEVGNGSFAHRRGADRWFGQLARLLPGLRGGHCSLSLFDRHGAVLWQSPLPGAPWPALIEKGDSHELDRFGVHHPAYREIFLYFHPTWVGYRVAAPGTDVPEGCVDHLMLLVDLRRVPPDLLMQLSLLGLRREGWRVGFLNRQEARQSRLPAGLSLAGARRLARAAVRSGEPVRLADGSLALAIPTAGPTLAIGIVPPAAPVLPAASLGLLCLWLPIAVWRGVGDTGRRLPLAGFLPASLGLAAGIPLLVTLLFWTRFTDTLTASLEAGELERLGQALIHVDNRFPVVLRQRQAEFRRVIGAFEHDHHSLDRLLDELAVMELSCKFDNCFVISTAGAILRRFSHMGPFYRPFSLLPRERRRQALQDSLEVGRFPLPYETEVMMRISTDAACIEDLWSFRVNSADDLTKIMANLGKSLVNRYNQDVLGLPPPPGSQEEDTASLLYGGLFETAGGDLMKRMLSMLGQFSAAGSGKNGLQMYVDVLEGPDGHGAYGLYGVQHMMGVEMAFLRDLFANGPLQAEGMAGARIRFYAQSSQAGFAFPAGERPPLLASWGNRLEPPRLLRGGVTTLAGERVLVAAFACRNMANYFLFAVEPYAPLADRVAGIRGQLAGALALLSVLLLVIAWRLREGVLVPARALMAGVQAMEARAFDHRITVGTGDEWGDLATAFNQTLETMEELEVASVIQARLFPAGPVSGAAGAFRGRSRTTQEVGGDYFDAVATPDGSLAFFIGDVTGHGVSAALVVAMAKSAFGHLVRAGTPSPAAVLTGMGGLFRDHLRKTKAMTGQMGLLAPDGTLRFSNAGHVFPFLVVPGQPVRRLEHPGLPLGIRARKPYTDQVVPFPPGSRLVLFTDGIVEAADPEGRRFSFDALERLLEGSSGLGAEALLDRVFSHLRAFCRERAWEDDVTMAVLEAAPAGPPGLDNGRPSLL
ncbi:MAG: SpoIIE family protein phosphatase [Candidatus Riflebacteria bacterium]|nr:SpoIIE family protein phosphatase [Candidatus Riflebacteria bacterium]